MRNAKRICAYEVSSVLRIVLRRQCIHVTFLARQIKTLTCFCFLIKEKEQAVSHRECEAIANFDSVQNDQLSEISGSRV